ncbi:hypothetical protein MRX96_005002 [Rhipicephalus microplus]
MGHPDPLDFFATQFFVLPWIVMLLQNFDQPTGSPLSCGAGHLPVNTSPHHDGCASPATTVHWNAHHRQRYHYGGLVVISWHFGFQARYLLTAPPFHGALI